MWTFIIAFSMICGAIVGTLAARRGDDLFERVFAFVIFYLLAGGVVFLILCAIYGYFAFVYSTLV